MWQSVHSACTLSDIWCFDLVLYFQLVSVSLLRSNFNHRKETLRTATSPAKLKHALISYITGP